MDDVIIPRLAAKQQGLKFYCTGEPCPHGHLSDRYTSNRACVACTRVQSEKWYSAPENASKRAAKTKKWREENYEYDRARQKKWHAENKEFRSLLTKDWRSRNWDKFKKKQKEWWKSNRHRASVYNNSYRSRKKNNGGSHTVDDILEILILQCSKCALCGARLGRKRHVDHIVPLLRGGRNDRRNLQILCPPCNQRKSSKDQMEFMRELGFLL